MLKKQAREITGGLSKPSKMPGPAHNLPAQACKTGAKLVKVPGSVCAGCYALKGRYRFKNVQAALNRRLQALEDRALGGCDGNIDQGPGLVQVARLRRYPKCGASKKYFKVCKLTPRTRHWMPTREAQFLKDIDPATVPPNLIIRMSSHMIGQGPVKQWPWTSTVSTAPEARTCPAPDQGNECGSCRACWDRSTPNVCYGKH
jgi:hypothetical protein